MWVRDSGKPVSTKAHDWRLCIPCGKNVQPLQSVQIYSNRHVLGTEQRLWCGPNN
uniref:Uncharacterized protein n=1 Tax=Arundo donax TaxID=35708 RepID=A0A0A9B0J7_ARUDO